MGLLLVSALLLAACGSDEATPDDVLLRVVMAEDWIGTAPVLDAVRAFEAAHPHVQVQLQGFPFAQIIDTVRSGIEAGEPHDVVQWHAFAAAAQGLAEPLDDLWAEHLDEAEFVPGAVVDVTWAGARYGVPLDTNALVLIANPDLFESGAAEAPRAPRTFEDFRALAASVTTDEGVRGTAVSADSWVTYGWIRANGGEVVTIADDGTVTFSLDDPRVVESVAFLGDLVRDGVAYPPFSRDVSTDAYALFEAGNMAMHASGTWDIAALEGSVPWEPEVHLLPGGTTGATSGSALGGSSLFVPVGSTNRHLAFEFMQALIEDDIALELARQEGRLPARARLFEDAFFDTDVFRTVAEQLESAHPMLLIAFPEASQAFKEAIEAVVVGGSNAADALGRAQRVAVASLAPAL